MSHSKQKSAKRLDNKAARKYERLQNEIFSYCNRHNLHVIVTDMMSQAFLRQAENPSMFMVEYLMNLNIKNMKQQRDITGNSTKRNLVMKGPSPEEMKEMEQRRKIAIERQSAKTPIKTPSKQEETGGKPKQLNSLPDIIKDLELSDDDDEEDDDDKKIENDVVLTEKDVKDVEEDSGKSSAEDTAMDTIELQPEYAEEELALSDSDVLDDLF